MANDQGSRCLTHLFEAQVRRAPQNPAVSFYDQQLTYGELNGRANQLARYLKRHAVGPDVLVGLSLDRSLEMVVGLLAILKAGGAYVPLDPAFPQERLAFMLQDSKAPVLLTQRRLTPNLLPPGTEVLCLDTDWGTVGQEDKEDLPCETTADNLAYVIYTSGSTGKPKGVQLTHRTVVNFLTAMQNQPGLADRDVLLAITTLSFDMSVMELLLPLVVGARAVIVSRETASDGAELTEWLAKTGASVMQATPATWRLLLHSGWQGDKRLKIISGGEALSRELANQLLARGDSLWNGYGPTETTVYSTLHRVEPGAGTVPIGRPVAQTQIYLLGSDGQRVPAGVPGELHIGGAGLARGYRNRPALTAEKFIPDPWSDQAGARLYRTGDLARLLPDGTIEYLGRMDHQVKIRGYRIELGEIEAILGQHPAVRETVVLAREDGPGDKRLVAYVVAANGHEVTNTELRRFLKEKLPDYMVPAAFVRLQGLPLTPNGKVNRLALPAPDHQRPDLERTFLAPRDRVEHSLAKIWEKLLGIRPIGVKDNIFELGVDSLTAARLFAAIEKTFGKRLPPGPLFHAPTIEQLADILRQKGETSRWSSLVAIQPRGSRPPLFCVHGGAGTILRFHPLARQLGPDQPVYGLQMRGLYGIDAPHTRVEDMTAHYLQEICTVQPAGPYYLVGDCFGAIVAFDMAQQLRKQGEKVAALIALNGPSPLYIRRTRNLPMPGEAPANRPSHWNTLRLRGRQNRFTHLVRTAGRFLYWQTRTLCWQGQVKLCLTLGLPLSQRVRDTFFLWSNAAAEEAYVPEVYPGRMILIYGQGLYNDPYLGWGGLVAGGIEATEIPGNLHGNHRELLKDPLIGSVAERIKESLQQKTESSCATAPRDRLAVGQ